MSIPDVPLSLLLPGIEIVESEIVPEKMGWFPIGPNRVAVNPTAWRKFLERLSWSNEGLTIVRRINREP